MSQDDDSAPNIPDWEIPANLQPDPADYGFDLERTLKSVVGLRASVPPDAFTAGTLGTDRVGNGVVIREDGLVLTIGYLITEAETVWLITNDGRAVAGHALAFDQISGFGLVQALGRLNLPAIEFGDSDALKVGAEAVMAAGGGRAHAIEAKVVGRQEFAGYWEYLLDNAIFTAARKQFFFEKKNQKTFIRLHPSSPGETGANASFCQWMKFFCFFLFTKRRLFLSRHATADREHWP
jgi:hypothetical protein